MEFRHELVHAGLLYGPWRGHADTETLLAAIEAWVLEAALQRCVGTFALALWDRRDRRLQLVRDRFCEKPLYWGLSGTGRERALLFGSELAGLRAWPGFKNAIHRPALVQLLRFGARAASTTIFPAIQQFLQGHLVSMQAPLEAELPQPLRPGGVFARCCQKALLSPLEILPLACSPWRLCWAPRCSCTAWPMCLLAPSSRAALDPP